LLKRERNKLCKGRNLFWFKGRFEQLNLIWKLLFIMKFPKEYFEEPKLVVIPIVDVLLAVFLFLAIIAFKTPFVSVFVQLPKGEGKEANLKIINISVDKEGKLLFEGKVVTLSKLKEILKERKPFVVNVTADERTPYKYVAKLLSTLQEIGITNVNLILKKAFRG